MRFSLPPFKYIVNKHIVKERQASSTEACSKGAEENMKVLLTVRYHHTFV